MFSGACVCCGASMLLMEESLHFDGILCMVGHIVFMGSNVNRDTVYVL